MSDLTRFEFSESDEPLPLQVAARWGFPLTHIYTDSGLLLYSIQDWINGIATTIRARKLWSDMQKQLSDSTGQLSIYQLPYVSTDGKTYQMDFTDAEGLYRIAQELRSTKARPALKAIKEFLAAAGVFTEAALRDPEGAKVWLDTRQKGKQARNALTATWQERGARGKDYANLTEQVNQIALGKTSDIIRQERSLKRSLPVRDHLTTQELAQLGVAENAAMALHADRDSHGFGQLADDIQDTRPVLTALKRLFGYKHRPK